MCLFGLFFRRFFLTFWFEFSRPPLVLFMSCGDACRSGPNSNEGSDSQRMARAPILIILCVLRLYTVYIGPNTLHIFVLEGEQNVFFRALVRWSDGWMVRWSNGQIAKWSHWQMARWSKFCKTDLRPSTDYPLNIFQSVQIPPENWNWKKVLVRVADCPFTSFVLVYQQTSKKDIATLVQALKAMAQSRQCWCWQKLIKTNWVRAEH